MSKILEIAKKVAEKNRSEREVDAQVLNRRLFNLEQIIADEVMSLEGVKTSNGGALRINLDLPAIGGVFCSIAMTLNGICSSPIIRFSGYFITVVCNHKNPFDDVEITIPKIRAELLLVNGIRSAAFTTDNNPENIEKFIEMVGRSLAPLFE